MQRKKFAKIYGILFKKLQQKSIITIHLEMKILKALFCWQK